MTTTTITVVVTKTAAALPAGVAFAGTNVSVKDNSGATLPGIILTGTESPAWTAVFTGATGSGLAQATITDMDTHGNPIGTPIVITETGTGGQTFPQSSSATITVS